MGLGQQDRNGYFLACRFNASVTCAPDSENCRTSANRWYYTNGTAKANTNETVDVAACPVLGRHRALAVGTALFCRNFHRVHVAFNGNN